jgi:galactose mutarotase-like enzyme
MDMSITGIIKQTQVFGPSLELRRTISATLGKATIQIHDEVLNRSNTPAPHMLLYHCNFGWPLVDEGTSLHWKGSWQVGGDANNKIFKEGNDFRKCPPALDEHSGNGEAVAFIDIKPDGAGDCSCGLYNSQLGIALSLKFKKEQLPWLINWQHWGKGEYVTALEPATNPPIGQSRAREQRKLILLQPGETRIYDLEIEVLNDKQQIDELIENTKW